MINEDERDLIKIQEIAAIFFIVALSIMIYLLNKKLKQNIPSYVDNKNTERLSEFNKIFILGIFLAFLYISYTSYKKSGNYADGVAAISAAIAVIPPIIMIYALYLAKYYPRTMNPLL